MEPKHLLYGLIVLLCVAAMLPPAPKKRHKPVVETTQGAGAAKLIAKSVPPPAAPNYNRLLVWTWAESTGNYWSNTVFIIKTSNSLKTPMANWRTESWTPTNHWLFYVNLENPSLFFHVVVSNTTTRLVSE